MNLLIKWYKTILTLFKNKNQHGFSKYCLSGKCRVCQTPWPKTEKTILSKYLYSINYYEKYKNIFYQSNETDGLSNIGGIFKGGYLNLPSGMTGEQILKIAEILKPEYNKLINGDLEEESKKIAKLQGFNEKE